MDGEDEAQAVESKTMDVHGLGEIQVLFVGPEKKARRVADKAGGAHLLSVEDYPELRKLASNEMDWVVYFPAPSMMRLEALDALLKKLESETKKETSRMISIRIYDNADKSKADEKVTLLKKADYDASIKKDEWGFYHVQVSGDEAAEAYDLLKAHGKAESR
jgi:hypothetical protein